MKENKDKLYIIIPAYNEEENIEIVTKQWHQIVERLGRDSKLVIIDDGSKDSTYKKIQHLQNELKQLIGLTKPNSGHGATLLYGYNYALENNADYIFQTDSDGQTLPEEFENFWDNRKQYDAVIGNRNSRQDGISRVFVTKTLKLVIKVMFGVSITDCNTPFRLMNSKLLKKYIDKVPKDYNLSNVLLTVMFVKNNEKIKFLPITFRPRQGGVNSINLKRISKIGINAIKDFKKLKKSI